MGGIFQAKQQSFKSEKWMDEENTGAYIRKKAAAFRKILRNEMGKFFGTKWVNTLILCVNYSKIKAENEAVKQNLKGK